MIDPSDSVSAWWSYAQADSTVLGLGVAVLAVAAFAFVGSRVIARVRRRR